MNREIFIRKWEDGKATGKTMQQDNIQHKSQKLFNIMIIDSIFLLDIY